MAKTTSITIDPYTFYDYKAAFEHRDRAIAPTWVGDNWRRLMAYKLLESYFRNAARAWLDPNTTDADKKKRREYGDPMTIRDAIISSLLGDDVSIMVEGAEANTADDRSPDAIAFQDALLQWRRDERFDQKIIDCENKSVGLGDGVYVLVWDDAKRRPRVQVYDPGFYFPVLGQNVVDEYPETVHIAWEFEIESSTGTKRYLRRLTWRMGFIRPHDENGFVIEGDPDDPDTPEAVLFENETEDNPDEELEIPGMIWRDYPWNEELSDRTCFFTDFTWDLERVEEGLDQLVEEDALSPGFIVDLQCDFLPVVHVPSTIAGSEHFGTSCVALVIQIIDDLIATDTDLQAAAATTGTPPIALSGASAPKDADGNIKSYGPGTVFETGDGTATVIDTSKSLDALLKLKDALQERLATNSRVPESLLGKVKPNEVPSGIALTLSFTPHSGLIKAMRLVRDEKYSLLLKFVGRMMWYYGTLDVTTLPYANVVFGSFLPSDKQEMSSLISTLLQTDPPAISLETAVRMLMLAGYPIEDAIQEIERIETRDFEGANTMMEATGDVQAVRDYLRLGPAPEPDEEPEEPGVPGPPRPPSPPA